MEKLAREDLLPLEVYSEQRADFRARVIEHKRNRKVMLGDHISLQFEDRLTMHYQVQEMLRVERIFEATGIEDELATYNPLIPDGSNLKATLMVEYEDEAERKVALSKLIGVEECVWIRMNDFDAVRPIADEDLERETPDKTSSVHFLRFEFSPEMIAAAKGGAPIAIGVDHPEVSITIDSLPETVRAALVADLD